MRILTLASSCPLAVILLATGCAVPPISDAAPRPALINHVVYFELDDPSEADELIADCDELLATIPSVVSYWAGKPMAFGRDMVDRDYHVGLYAGFMTAEGYRDYLEHPRHLELVERWEPRLDRLLVRDVLDETP